MLTRGELVGAILAGKRARHKHSGKYVSGRVGQLARQKGHDRDAVFKTTQKEHSFPIGEVIGAGQ